MANTPKPARTSTTAAKAATVVTAVMARRQQIMWTALPNGLDAPGPEAKLKISVFVAPRLGTRVEQENVMEHLSSYPDFLDWPAIVKTLKFEVQFGDTPPVKVMRSSVDPDSGLWKALFDSKSPVKPFDLGDYHERPILSYPVAHVQSFIKEKYMSVAVKPEMVTQLPPIHHLASSEMLGMIAFEPHPVHVAAADLKGFVPDNPAVRITTDLAQTLKIQKVIPQRPAPDAQKDFVQLSMFHAKPGKAKSGKAEPVKPVMPELEFHQALSNIGRYPELMRKLGMVIDLELAVSSVPAGSSTISIIPKWPSEEKSSGDVTPRTKFKLTSKLFAAAPRPDSDLQDGMLNLSDPSYEVVQLDVDGAAMNSMNLANNVTRMLGRNDGKETAGLPALRSAGISVVKSGRDKAIHSAVQAGYANHQKMVSVLGQAKTATDGGIVLYADDLTRGCRVDVWDTKTKTWRSLCQRIGRYQFKGGLPDLTIEDEGFVSSAVTRSVADDSKEKELRLHEALFRWSGWSLCASRPGKTILLNDTPGVPEHGMIANFPLKTSFATVPGTLPKLRFGGSYRIRARVVDLAGNSLKSDDLAPDDFSAATEQFTYTRFEPVASPTVVPRQDLSAGQFERVRAREAARSKAASSPKVVEGLRSAADRANRAGGAEPHAAGPPGESVERLVIRSYNDAASKDKTATKETSDRHVAPPKAAQLTAETHGMFDAEKGLNKADYKTITELDGMLEPHVADDKLKLLYLPDPLAIGAVLVNLPGAGGKATTVDYYPGAKWPEAKPFRLQIAEGSGAPKLDEAARVLTVFLPKAEIVTFPLSSRLKQDDLPPMGVWQWLQDAAYPKSKAVSPAPKSTIKRLNFAPAGVGAQMPAALSKIAPVQVTTQALSRVRAIALDGRHWMFTPSKDITLVHAVQQPLMSPVLTVAPRRVPGGTYADLEGNVKLHGKSTGKLDLEAQWDEPIDPVSEETWRTIKGASHAFEETIAYGQDEYKYRGQRHNFGDTKYRKIRYSAVATTRFREYFPPAIINDPKNLIRTGEAVEVHVPSSARPAAPQIVYIVPTFAWESSRNKEGFLVRKRVGGGLRVYLERPWFSSGDGEFLGVVLAAPAGPKPSIIPYTTQWGADPIWDSKATYKAPLLEHFKKATATANDLSLDEIKDTQTSGGPKVSVAGHKVEYDADRRLWYCDLEIDAGPSYWPFVRLALARFQPHSIDDAHLSRVVIADFAQLAPDRTATIARSAKQIKVTVTGASYAASSAGQQSSEIEVSLESRPAASAPDLGWMPMPDSTCQLEHPKSLLGFGQTQIWSGDLGLPTTESGKKYRLVIKEYERFRIEPIAERQVPALTPPTSRRLVYADVIEL